MEMPFPEFFGALFWVAAGLLLSCALPLFGPNSVSLGSIPTPKEIREVTPIGMAMPSFDFVGAAIAVALIVGLVFVLLILVVDLRYQRQKIRRRMPRKRKQH